MLAVQDVDRPALEWQAPGDHLEEDDTKGVEIGTDVDRPGIAELFGAMYGPVPSRTPVRVNRGLEVSTREMGSLVSLATVVKACGSRML